jgi:Ca-activated chloride channel homolog
MSTPDQNLSPSDPNEMQRDPRHEQLCAYLMGEGTPAERLELETLLSKDTELAAERDRLAGVLGLVQGAFAGEERLSEGALSSLLEAAQSSDTPRTGSDSGAAGADSHAGPRLVTDHGAPAGGSPSHHAPSRRGSAAGPFLRSAASVLLVTMGCWVAYRHPGAQNYDLEMAHGDIEVPGSVDRAERLLVQEALRGRFDRLTTLGKNMTPDASVSEESAARQEQLFRKAQSAFLRDQYGEAEQYAGLILEEDPRNPVAAELAAVAFEMRHQVMEGQPVAQYREQWQLGFDELVALEAMPATDPSAQYGYVPITKDGAVDMPDAHLRQNMFGGVASGADRQLKLSDVTNGLEDLASQGLTNGGGGAVGSNAAGQPEAGLFFGGEADPSTRARSESLYSLQAVTPPPTRGMPQDSAGVAVSGRSVSKPPERVWLAGGLTGNTAPAAETSAPVAKDAANVRYQQQVTPELLSAQTTSSGVDKPLGVARVVHSSTPTVGAGGGGGAGGAYVGPASPAGPATPGHSPGPDASVVPVVTDSISLGVTVLPVESPTAPDAGVAFKLAPVKAEVRGGRVAQPVKSGEVLVARTGGQPGISVIDEHLEVLGELEDTTLLLDFDVERESRRVKGLTERSRDSLRAAGEDETRRPVFTPAQVERGVEIQFGRIHDDCVRRPHERPRDMYFRWWGDNPWEITETDKLSTFAADVDTASYVLARRYLREGNLPTREQIRTEEFVNYFDPDIAAPVNSTFAIETEMAPSLFGGSERRWQLRVGVRGKEVQAHERQPLSLTFVIDTSGSMEENQRLELVKHALRLLVSQLDGRDEISIVAFNKEARQILPMTSAANRGVIESAIHPLSPDGGTNAEAGLVMGYEVAMAGLNPQSHNRVILLSDGVANIGETDQDRINANITRHRESGIYLNTIGVGMSNHNDVFLEQLANKGDGVCDYVDDAASTERAIVERFTGALIPIASDVKIQVEFDPEQVLRYRLLGYENRAIADNDFRNDAVDAGEIGAGHQVTAIYEIERAGGPAPSETPLAKVNLRWKEPKAPGQDKREIQVTEISQDVSVADSRGSWDAASVGFRRASLVAQFAECLRASTHSRGDSLEALRFEFQRLADLPELAQDSDTAELPGLVQRAIDLGLDRRFLRSELGSTVDEYRRHKYLREQLDELGKRPNSNGVEREDLIRLKQINGELESRIQDLLRKDLEAHVR